MLGIEIKICGLCHVRPAVHKCFCPECSAAGKDPIHLVCEPCYQEALSIGAIKPTAYKLHDMSDDLKERLK